MHLSRWESPGREVNGVVRITLAPGVGPVYYEREQTESGELSDTRTRTIVLRLIDQK